ACFNNSLQLASRGVNHIVINDKKRDTGQFLVNFEKESKEEIQQHLFEKIEDFMKWYDSFQNKEPISRLSIYSADFACHHHCKMPMNTKISVLESIFDDLKTVKAALVKVGQKYGLKIEVMEEL